MKELRLTSYNTIAGDDFNEMYINSFFEEVDQNLGEKYGIIYEEDTKRFKVIFNGNEYYLILDKLVMDDYIFERPNDFTSALKYLVDKTEYMKQKENDDKERVVAEKQIIKNAERGIMPNDDDGRLVYIDYLKKTKKFSLSKFKSYFSNLIVDLKVSYKIIDKIIWKKLPPFSFCRDKVSYFLLCFLIGCLIPFISILVIGEPAFNGEYDSFLISEMLFPFSSYLVPMTTFFSVHLKTRLNRFKKNIETRKLINYKIEQLALALGTGRINSNTYPKYDKTLPSLIKDQGKPRKDPILQNLKDIVKRIDYISGGDKDLLLSEIDGIADEYIDRYEKIKKRELEDGLQLGIDNLLTLQSEMLERIVSLEHRIEQIRTNDITVDDIRKQYLDLRAETSAIKNGEIKIIGGERSPRTKKQSENG